MKQLKELKGTYNSRNITALVDFIGCAPIRLPENGNYRFEMQGPVVHIYGVDDGISHYELGELPQDMMFYGTHESDLGTVIKLSWRDIDSVFLHSLVLKEKDGELITSHRANVAPERTRIFGDSSGSESRGGSGESRY